MQKESQETRETESHRSTRLKLKKLAKKNVNFKSKIQMQQNQKMNLESRLKISTKQ